MPQSDKPARDEGDGSALTPRGLLAQMRSLQAFEMRVAWARVGGRLTAWPPSLLTPTQPCSMRSLSLPERKRNNGGNSWVGGFRQLLRFCWVRQGRCWVLRGHSG